MPSTPHIQHFIVNRILPQIPVRSGQVSDGKDGHRAALVATFFPLIDVRNGADGGHSGTMIAAIGIDCS